MKVLISTLFFLFISISNSVAEELRYYNVEIIVIQNQSPGAKASEHWPLEVNINKPANTVELGMPPPTEWLPLDADFSISFKELPPEEYQLNAEIEKISRSNSQQVIFHRAWRQPGLDNKIAMPVYFKQKISELPLDTQSKMQTEVEGKIISTENATLDSAMLGTVPLETDSSTLEGIFRVSLSRYLHLEAELIYREKLPAVAENEYIENNESFYSDATNTIAAEDKQGVIYLKQTRNRMKSNELHYIDHPVLGILVKITPYIKPEIEDAPMKSGVNKL